MNVVYAVGMGIVYWSFVAVTVLLLLGLVRGLAVWAVAWWLGGFRG